MRARAQRFWRDLPLRVKLTVLYMGLLVGLITILGLTLYWDTRHFLIASTATRIRAQAKPVIERWLYSPTPGEPTSSTSLRADARRVEQVAPALARDLTSRDTVALVLDRNGHVLADGHYLPEEPLSPPPDPQKVALALAGENEVTYITSSGESAMLVLLIPLRARPGDPHILGVVQMSTPLEPVEHILERQRLLLTLLGGLILVLGVGLGLWITSNTLRPLNEMIDVCQHIAEGDFSRRVPSSDRRDEIGQLARAFNTMVVRLEQVFRAQQRFIANAAHELRTPLTALRGSLEVLLRGGQDDPATVSRLSQGMYREVTRLNRLAEQLLDLTRLESPLHVQRQPVHLPTFFTSLASQARLLAQGDTFILEEGPDLTLNTDPDMLTQVLFNFIANAVQHNDPGITIRVGWALDGDSVRIWVEDNGVGIAAKDLEHIFEPFYRGDRSRSRRRGGTGLGLALSKAMVENLGGRVRVESEEGKGARFEIVLPLA